MAEETTHTNEELCIEEREYRLLIQQIEENIDVFERLKDK